MLSPLRTACLASLFIGSAFSQTIVADLQLNCNPPSVALGSSGFKTSSVTFGGTDTLSKLGAVGSSAAKTSLSSITLLKNVDGCTLPLFQLLTTGKTLKGTSVISAVDSSTTPPTLLLQISLQDVTVSSQQLTLSQGASLAESVTISFSQITLSYPQPDGSKASYCWSVPDNGPC